jgi:demethylmenaquinone methyltransferase/2-methoxy-6-polyprenyl-1,4-benzoquinol methylase
MFASIAGRYDLNNRLHSFGLDQRWRRRAVQVAGVTGESDVVDVACGTGDLSEAFADAGARRVIGIDFTPQMLDIARDKGRRAGGARSRVIYREGDAMALDLPDASADVVSIAFGIRNVAEPRRAIAEFRRILRPGGRLVILEFSEPRNALIRWSNALYTRRIMPWTAGLVARDRVGAYRYLPRSVQTFLTPQALADMVREAGFGPAFQEPLTFGVCTLTRAAVPDR